MPSLATQANSYISPMIDYQLFGIERVFSDKYTLIIPMCCWSNPTSLTHTSNIYVCGTLINKIINGVHYKGSKHKQESTKVFLSQTFTLHGI